MAHSQWPGPLTSGTLGKVPNAQPHPDVVAHGSLAAALQAVARQRGLEVGQVVADENQPLYRARVVSDVPRREPMSIHTLRTGDAMRLWMIGGQSHGIELISGITDDLSEVARAAGLWKGGAAIDDIERQLSFVKLHRLALAAEEGPARVVTEQWRYIREQAGKKDWPEQGLLVEAAYQEPKLRQLYPYMSHYSLRFSTTTGQPLSPDCVVIEVGPGDRTTSAETG